ncbi:hypothetical protein K1W69_25050 [Hoeflea sp. WL0058]|uniref:Uncharacterized protein n=1 Tax=Flavimaribacter sediminis TaxID=2865987 RepID=A0AAE2ZR71_9HYPH|nr:hypothetical protein [Flavimaribacter sediminis]MBW8640484.1 hypothetical protein [Flavimaribacter sediminis]
MNAKNKAHAAEAVSKRTFVDAIVDRERRRVRFDPDTEINFWGHTLKLGDRIIGDPDVGGVSYFPDDYSARESTSPSRPRPRPVTLAEILFRDGVFLNGDDDLIRSSHGHPIETIHDRFVSLSLASRTGATADLDTVHTARLGQRFITRDGQDSTIGYVAYLADSGFDREGMLVHLSGSRRAFRWTITDQPPTPWSYLMQISGYASNRYSPRKPSRAGWQAWRAANGFAAPKAPAGNNNAGVHRAPSKLPVTHVPVRA